VSREKINKTLQDYSHARDHVSPKQIGISSSHNARFFYVEYLNRLTPHAFSPEDKTRSRICKGRSEENKTAIKQITPESTIWYLGIARQGIIQPVYCTQ